MAARHPVNPPAFPLPTGWQETGMCLRDYFAAHAPAPPHDFDEQITREHFEATRPIVPEAGADADTWTAYLQARNRWEALRQGFTLALWRYTYADAMLAERERS